MQGAHNVWTIHVREVIYVGRSAQRQNRDAQLEINLTNTPDNTSNTTNAETHTYTNTTNTHRQIRATQLEIILKVTPEKT